MPDHLDGDLPESEILSQVPFIILAGGLGTRLRPALPHVPKALAPIGQEPFLNILIELLYKKGARHIVLALGFEAEKISQSIQGIQYPGLKIEQSIETEPSGTAGALKLVADFFNPRAFVLNGDTYFDFDYEKCYLDHHREVKSHHSMATIAVARGHAGKRYGSIVLDDRQQCIMRFVEKSDEDKASRWVNGGVYLIERELIEQIPDGQPVSLEREVFPKALRDGIRISVFKEGNNFFDIGTPQSWKLFASHYLEKKA